MMMMKILNHFSFYQTIRVHFSLADKMKCERKKKRWAIINEKIKTQTNEKWKRSKIRRWRRRRKKKWRTENCLFAFHQPIQLIFSRVFNFISFVVTLLLLLLLLCNGILACIYNTMYKRKHDEVFGHIWMPKIMLLFPIESEKCEQADHWMSKFSMPNE